MTTSVNTIIDAVKVIKKAAEGGSQNGNNLVVTGYVTAGAGLVEKAKHEFAKLEKLVSKLDYVYEQIEVQFPDKFSDAVKDKLNKQEDDLQNYRGRGNIATETSDEKDP